jgi:excisionase family DNA binding protein
MAVQPLGRSVTIDRAASLLHVSRRTIYNRIRDGRLQTIRTIGGSQRVLVSSLDFARDGSLDSPSKRERTVREGPVQTLRPFDEEPGSAGLDEGRQAQGNPESDLGGSQAEGQSEVERAVPSEVGGEIQRP